ncbi:RepB family protein [Klebsiella grimontii]
MILPAVIVAAQRKISGQFATSEKQMAAVARKRVTHKEIKVFVRNPLKDILIELCNRDGITQAQFVEKLLEKEFKAQGLFK